MLIVEQDKNFVINFEQSYALSMGYEKKTERYGVNVTLPGRDIRVGLYSTKERACEVLKLICQFYNAQERLFEMPKE